MQFRIGDRDPQTGLYYVIYPDGSSTLNGIKAYNAAHVTTDLVLATRRSDGMMILDAAKAVESTDLVDRSTVQKFGERPVGYLKGQVFNNEEEVLTPILQMKFAPSVIEGAIGNSFDIRVSIDRKQRKDLRFKVALSGTLSQDYYTLSVDPAKDIVLSAQQEYRDISILFVANIPASEKDKTVNVALRNSNAYKIGSKRSVGLVIVLVN